MSDLARRWIDLTAALGGDAARAVSPADELARRYDAAGRTYHNTLHIQCVLADVQRLAEPTGIVGLELLTALCAACAHDVVYEGRAGEDERASAQWAEAALAAAGVDPPICARVATLILATAEHRSDELAARVLLDADLAILAAPPERYDAYRAAVRAEYAHLDDELWRSGRGHVLRSLLSRDQLFLTETGRTWWEADARRNMAGELRGL